MFSVHNRTCCNVRYPCLYSVDGDGGGGGGGGGGGEGGDKGDGEGEGGDEGEDDSSLFTPALFPVFNWLILTIIILSTTVALSFVHVRSLRT